MSDEQRPVGRPAIYTPELAAEVCRRISEGESLRQVCRDESMPSTSTVLRWARENDEFCQHYARAREDLLEHWAEDILEIADDSARDTVQTEDGSRVDHEHVARARLRVDSRKWLMSKLGPKKYGDRMATEVSGPNGGAIETKTTLDVANLNDEQLRALASIAIPPS